MVSDASEVRESGAVMDFKDVDNYNNLSRRRMRIIAFSMYR